MKQDIFEHIRDKIVEVLTTATKLLELKLCFREHFSQIDIPCNWGEHVNPACIYWKKQDLGLCCNFDGFETDRALMGMPQGRIHTCPRGFTEIALPVTAHGRQAGTLFGGPCWTKKSPPPIDSLKIVRSKVWLIERQILMQAIASRIRSIIEEESVIFPVSRQRQIMDYIQECIKKRADVHDLAKRLNLSLSRTSHVVQELFGMSLPLLAREVKLLEAAKELVYTDQPIAEIAWKYGIEDAAYFSRIFTDKFNISPKKYRATYKMKA